MLLCCYFYIIFIFIILHCPLSRPDLIYISLLIIPCIIYYMTNKETLKYISLCGMNVYSTLYKFPFLNGISEINQLFDDII